MGTRLSHLRIRPLPRSVDMRMTFRPHSVLGVFTVLVALGANVLLAREPYRRAS